MKKIICCSLIFLCLSSAYGQDPHFSQMDLVPGNLNPALAGANYDAQVHSLYRNQWNSVGYAFQTTTVAADLRLVTDRRNPRGYFGIGVNFMNDVAGSARMTNNALGVNFAYHLRLENNHYLGLGTNFGFAYSSVSGTNGRWASQFDGVEYNMLIPSGENFQAATYSTFDIGAGMVYTYKKREVYMTKNDTRHVNIGFAAYHLNRPQHSFIDQSVARMPIRFAGFVKVAYGIDNSNLIVEPGLYYNHQGRTRDLLIGSDLRYILQDKSQRTNHSQISTLGFGVYYRALDALVARMSYEYSGFRASIAYDFNISPLSRSSKTFGGFEIGLSWIIDNLIDDRLKK